MDAGILTSGSLKIMSEAKIKLSSSLPSSKIIHTFEEDFITLAWMQKQIEAYNLDVYIFERQHGIDYGWKTTSFSWEPLFRYSGWNINPITDSRYLI